MMKEIVSTALCCGCGVCKTVCPKSAIRMTFDHEGFVIPKIDASKCVDCGNCRQHCPVLNQESPQLPIDTVAGYAKDPELRRKGSSGGFFGVLASWVLESGGVVFGAAFDADWELRHVGVESPDELECLYGSKYFQSRADLCFDQLRKALEGGRKVLFCGTPCQVAAVRMLLPEASRRELITVDLFCHGVPNSAVWKKYLTELLEKKGTSLDALEHYSFRDKETFGYFNFCTTFRVRGGKPEHVNDDSFMLAFRDMALRRSCFKCSFKNLRSHSDFSIGDGWGIRRGEYVDDLRNGASVVLVNTERGQDIFASLKERFCIITAGVPDFSALKKCNPMVTSSVRKYRRRQYFFQSLEAGEEFEASARRWYKYRTLREKAVGALRRVLVKIGMIDY